MRARSIILSFLLLFLTAITPFAAYPQEPQAEELQADAIRDELMRSFAERIYRALKKYDIKVGLVQGAEHVQLRWSSGWQPPTATVVTKVDALFRLWENGEAAERDYTGLVQDALGADPQSSIGAVAADLSFGEIRGILGGRAGELFVYDETEKRWRPQALVHGVFICGDLTVEITAHTRGQFQTQSTELAVPGPDGRFKPEFIREAEALLRQPQEAIRMIAEKLGHAFENRDVCKARTEDEKILAKFIPVMQALAMPPEVRQPNPNRIEDPVREHLFWENTDGMRVRFSEPGEWMKVTAEEYDSPDLTWSAFDFEVDSAKRGTTEFAEFMDGRSFEDASEILDIKPMLGMAVAGIYGPVDLVGKRGEATVFGTLVCGYVKFNFTAVAAQPFQTQDTPREAMLAWSRDASNALYSKVRDRIVALAVEIVRAQIDCPTPVEITAAEAEPAAARLFDANPLFISDEAVADLSKISELSPEALGKVLASLSEERVGAAADGVSRLVVVLEAEHPASVVFTVPGATDQEAPDGRVLPLNWAEGTPPTEIATETVAVDGRHYAFALYQPPESFGVGTRLRFVSIEASLTALGEHAVSPTASIQVMLGRPPVVLVHGTYSTPGRWTESLEGLGGKSMVEVLEAAGYKTFLVDYTATNGSRGTDISHLANNREVVWRGRSEGENQAPGQGIETALDYFRNELNLAATQADVVGHSLGGTLARVWASPNFRTPEEPYFRPENFRRGDIHRLITLCTPHHGSDLPRILGQIENVRIGDVPINQWAVNKGLSGLYNYFAGMKSGAAKDQIPESEALKRIGATDVRAHAIGCIVGLEHLYDPAIIKANREYVQMFTHLARTFAEMPGVMAKVFAGDEEAARAFAEPRPTCNAAGRERPPTRIVERLQEVVALMDWAKWDADMRETAASMDSAAQVLLPFKDPILDLLCSGHTCGLLKGSLLSRAMEFGINEVYGQPLPEQVLIQYFRVAIFGNQPNDGTVRLESQLAGLGEAHTTILTGVIHGAAPLTGKVQQRVVELLSGSDEAFAPALPPAGAALTDRPLGTLVQSLTERLWAINRSNIVPAQAEAIARVADACNVIIMVRPVNEHSTPLIAAGQATKNMHVKGKSADWGPQKGYIAVDQAYSKLANEPADRDKNIGIYNCEVVASLTKEGIARRRPLLVTIEGQNYEVRKPEAPTGIFPPPIYLKAGNGYFMWPSRAPAPPGVDDESTLPLEVLTAPDKDLYLTADYDLLAIGTTFPDQPSQGDFDPNRGYITTFQNYLLSRINEAVRQTGYTGGNVVHHGPENQFPQSPGNDYPVTAFVPGPQDTRIETIEKGPEGRTDALLKRFFTSHKTNRWSLLANDVWQWGDWTLFGYREEDAPKVKVSEKVKPRCHALPPCNTPAPEGGLWNLPDGFAPNTVGCWPSQ